MKFLKKVEKNILQVKNIAETCNISQVLAEILLSRGIDNPADVSHFLYGTTADFMSPYIFPDMKKIVNKLLSSFKTNKKIVIYGDYDCDGVGAISILLLACKNYGINLDYYIPIRAKEGYGLNINALNYIKGHFNPDILLTVDCGINSIKEVNYAKSLGMDVIITDHHQPTETLPDCLILNPFLAPNSSPLCGAGVVFTLVSALFGQECAIKYIDICAISTLADIVPLLGDNRLIVKYGMQCIRKGKCRPGIKELIYSANCDFRQITTGDIGYKIAPRINASGRLSSAEISLRLLLDEDITSLKLIAEQLCLLNTYRQELNANIFNEALEQLQTYDFSKYKLIFLQGEWEEGVVGIVCAKLVEYFNLPAILVCKQKDSTILKGSARSINGINLFELFDKNNKFLFSYGGHSMAAGLSFEERYFDKILNIFNDYIIKNFDGNLFEKVSYYDIEMDISNFSLPLANELELLEPYGYRNPMPVFCDTRNKMILKQIGKSKHCKIKFPFAEMVAFDKLAYKDLFENNEIKFTYIVNKNIFNGRENRQFVLKKIIYNTANILAEDVLINFCKSFIKSTKNIKKSVNKNNINPILYVTYDINKIENFVKTNNNISINIFNQEFELQNTLIVAPDIEFPFYYFSKIIILDDIGNSSFDLINKSGIKYEYLNERIFDIKIDIFMLRKIYSVFKDFHFVTKHYNVKSIFEELKLYKDFDFSYSINEFIVGCYIFIELGLLKIGEDGIIIITNKKVDLTNSTIYKYFNI